VLLALFLLLFAGAGPPVTARIATGDHPCGIAAGFGAVWVANDENGTLVRVNPKRNRVTKRLRVGRGACSVTTGSGFVWLTNHSAGTVVRIAPKTFRRRSVKVGAGAADVVVSAGHVWASTWDDGTVVELDPRSLRVVRRLEVGPNAAGLTRRPGSIWVGFGRSATAVGRIEPESGKIARVSVGVRTPVALSDGTRDLWIAADGNALVHLDPRTNRVLGTARFGRTLGRPIAAGDGSIWVPDKEIDRVFRVDPASGKPIDSFAGGDGAWEGVRAFGSVWIASYAASDVWRYRPR
jgi:streptogramin lyase